MRSRVSVIGAVLALLAGLAHAQDAGHEIFMPQDAAIFQEASPAPSFLVAANAASAGSNASQTAASAAAKPEAFEEPIFTLNKTHKFFGASTIVAALATMVTAPGEGCEANCPPPSQLPPRDRTGTHAKLARATVGLAAAAIATGIMAHWDDISWDAGITDPDNLHALLGITGAVLMAKAVNKSAGSTVPTAHAGQAELGAALMAIGIKMVW